VKASEQADSLGPLLERISVLSLILGTVLILAASSACVQSALAAPPSPYLKSDHALVDYYAGIEGAKLGVNLPGGPDKFIELKEISDKYIKVTEPDGKVTADLGTAQCTDAQGGDVGPAAGCVITLAVEPHRDGELRQTVAHEVFHVFQELMSGTLTNFNRMPYAKWLIEGSAAWVEEDLVHPDAGARSFWHLYLNSPGYPLFKRSYNAVGFFGHLASSGISPWNVFPAMFAAKSDPEAYAAAVGGNKAFLNSEASVFFRKPSFGPEWDQQGVNIPSPAEVKFKPDKVTMPAGSKPKTLTVAPYTDGTYEVSVTTPVFELKVYSGGVRLHSINGGDVDEVEPTHLVLCGDPNGCRCPDQPSTDYPRFNEGDLAVTGGPTGGEVELIARDKCEPLLPQRSCQGLLPLPTGFTDEPYPCFFFGPEVPVEENIYNFPTVYGPSQSPVKKLEPLSDFDRLEVFKIELSEQVSTPSRYLRESVIPDVVCPPIHLPGIGNWAVTCTEPEKVTVETVDYPENGTETIRRIDPEFTYGEMGVRNDVFLVMADGTGSEVRGFLATAATELDGRSDQKHQKKMNK
jgi:hypothetical protein